MRRLALTLLLLLFGSTQLPAQMLVPNPWAGRPYSGPCDLATFTAWYGLRACSAAIAATGTQNAVDLVRNDAATCTGKIGKNGYLDVSVGTPCNGNTQTITAWNAAGAAHSCVASISGTTLTRTGSPCTIQVGDVLSGTGVTAGTYLVAIGTCPVGIGGSCTISVSQTVVAETITGAPYGMRLSKFYDQVAGNACTAATCDLSANGAQAYPLLILSGCGVYPCLADAANNMLLLSANNFTPSNASLSISTVANRAIGTQAVNLFNVNGADKIVSGGANTWTLAGSTGSFNATASDAAFHAANGVIATGTGNGVINIDGTETTGTTGSAGSAAAKPVISSASQSGQLFYVYEAGFKDNTAWSGSTRTALCRQQHTAWSIAGSC